MITTSTSQDYPIFEYTSQINPSPLVMMERSSQPIKWKPKNKIELAPNCPRCASSNTKFCYYNNYSLSQPRYFCKACRRYWTKGGSLRNVPVGGGCRRTRRNRAPKPNGSPNYSRIITRGAECSGPTISFLEYAEQNVGNGEPSSSRASIAPCDHNVEGSSSDFMVGAGADDRLRPRVDELINGEDFSCQNYNDFEMEGVFGDMLWEEGMNLASFGAQQASTLHNMQDFDIFATAENWSPFDLSGYEFFSKN